MHSKGEWAPRHPVSTGCSQTQHGPGMSQPSPAFLHPLFPLRTSGKLRATEHDPSGRLSLSAAPRAGRSQFSLERLPVETGTPIAMVTPSPLQTLLYPSWGRGPGHKTSPSRREGAAGRRGPGACQPARLLPAPRGQTDPPQPRSPPAGEKLQQD